MEHYIFSNTLQLNDLQESVHIEKLNLEKIKQLKEMADTDIYLCGGGTFAGWLLDHGMIDRLKVKINPIVLGEGVPLFGTSNSKVNWELTDSHTYDDGLIIATYQKKEEN